MMFGLRNLGLKKVSREVSARLGCKLMSLGSIRSERVEQGKRMAEPPSETGGEWGVSGWVGLGGRLRSEKGRLESLVGEFKQYFFP